MGRFLAFALPSLVLLIALFNLVLEWTGQAPDLGPLVGWHPAGLGLPGAWVLGTWVLEATALTALFLLVDLRGGWRFVNGLAACWLAWVFRGPLLVLSNAAAGGPREDWWALAARWLVLYTLAAIVLAVVSRVADLPRDAARSAEPPADAP